MKIGIISDTHIPVSSSEVPPNVLAALKGCDLILHAGDLIDIGVLEKLKNISKVEAVYGNMDPLKVRGVLKDKMTLKVEGKKIFLMHGDGDPKNLITLLKNEISDEKPDIVVFGHSHSPMNKYIDGVLFFNPGSPTDTVFAPYRSYGIIEITEGKINATIQKL